MNYERAIAWLAGPLATIIAVAATSLVHATISHNAALGVATFALSAAATYLGHARWLANLVAWWDRQNAPPEPAPPRLVAEKLRAQLTEAGIPPKA